MIVEYGLWVGWGTMERTKVLMNMMQFVRIRNHSFLSYTVTDNLYWIMGKPSLPVMALSFEEILRSGGLFFDDSIGASLAATFFSLELLT